VRHVLDEARLAATGRPLEHDRKPALVGRAEQLDFIPRGR